MSYAGGARGKMGSVKGIWEKRVVSGDSGKEGTNEGVKVEVMRQILRKK